MSTSSILSDIYFILSQLIFFQYIKIESPVDFANSLTLCHFDKDGLFCQHEFCQLVQCEDQLLLIRHLILFEGKRR